jgi:integrase
MSQWRMHPYRSPMAGGHRRDSFSQRLLRLGVGDPLRYSNWRTRDWLPAVKKASLDGLTFHELRHSATTAMVREGVHPRVIQHRLGHSKAELSMSVYAHVPTELDKAASDALESRFFGASGTDVARTEGDGAG